MAPSLLLNLESEIGKYEQAKGENTKYGDRINSLTQKHDGFACNTITRYQLFTVS